jgi:hypothetical protein
MKIYDGSLAQGGIMRSLYENAERKYQTDPAYRNLVDMMTHYAMKSGISVGELREAGCFAEYKALYLRPPGPFIVSLADRCDQGDEENPEGVP